MKVRTVAGLAALAMTLSSVTVWSVTPPGGFSDRLTTAVQPHGWVPGAAAVGADPASFQAAGTLRVEGRIGHAVLSAARDSETYLMVQVLADAAASPAQAAPLDLSIVIDRSGSMRGKRMANALDAARGMVRRLRDGDVVSVVTYNTATELLVGPTTIDARSREEVVASIRDIAAAGDTCISCGLETAMGLLGRRDDRVSRVLLLSDGEATAGVRDLAGFRRIASRARDMGCSVTAIGVDVDYNESIMGALALESNGRHYFVENAGALPTIFDQELASLVRTVATGAELRVSLAPGVQLDRVFDRAFRMEGNTLVVPMGIFNGAEEKTLLVRVRVPRGAEGERAIADVALAYQDLVGGGLQREQGRLATRLSSDPTAASALDPVVSARVGRSETSATLFEANDAFKRGDLTGARASLERKRAELRSLRDASVLAAPAPLKTRVGSDFDRQLASIGEAENAFATPPADAAGPAAAAPQESRAGKSAVRRNAEKATSFGF
jgi:Ca-activated chloride channel family protein